MRLVVLGRDRVGLGESRWGWEGTGRELSVLGLWGGNGEGAVGS